MKRLALGIGILFLSLLLAACGVAPMPPEVAVVPTLVPLPTDTPTLTATFTPSSTPTAASTSTATPTEAPTHAATPTEAPLFSVKAISYNILLGAGVSRAHDSSLSEAAQRTNRVPALVSVLREAGPDVVGIQEAYDWGTGDPPVIEQVADELGMVHYLALPESDAAILSKLKIAGAEDLSGIMGPSFGAVRADLSAPDGSTLTVFDVHLKSAGHTIRLCQAIALTQELGRYASKPAILMGDMNASASAPEMQIFQQAGWQPVTDIGFIDQIWVSPASSWSSTAWWEPATSPRFELISDHYPVAAEIAFYPRLKADAEETPTAVPTLKSSVWTGGYNPKPKPVPTVAPLPALTTPPLLSDYLTDAHSLRSYRFDLSEECEQVRWQSDWDTERISEGALQLAGEEPWRAGASLPRFYTPGTGLVLRFRFSRDAELEILMEHGEWAGDTYRRFGIYGVDGRLESSVWAASANLGGQSLSGSLRPLPDSWYNLALALSREGQFIALVWNPDDPSAVLEYRAKPGAEWAGLTWAFRVAANRGSVTVDDVTELSFTSMD
jgi:endonuclease/exonuclease/phosphatase family metal-dependent hydrolase